MASMSRKSISTDIECEDGIADYLIITVSGFFAMSRAFLLADSFITAHLLTLWRNYVL